jgi:hypothetical protein
MMIMTEMIMIIMMIIERRRSLSEVDSWWMRADLLVVFFTVNPRAPSSVER